jgi:hypothetical protein
MDGLPNYKYTLDRYNYLSLLHTNTQFVLFCTQIHNESKTATGGPNTDPDNKPTRNTHIPSLSLSIYIYIYIYIYIFLSHTHKPS